MLFDGRCATAHRGDEVDRVGLSGDRRRRQHHRHAALRATGRAAAAQGELDDIDGVELTAHHQARADLDVRRAQAIDGARATGRCRAGDGGDEREAASRAQPPQERPPLHATAEYTTPTARACPQRPAMSFRSPRRPPSFSQNHRARRPIPSGRLRRFVTSPPLVRFALALAPALAAAPFVTGCATAPSSSVRPGELVAGAAPATAAPPVRAEARLDNGIQLVIEENHVAPLVAIQVWVAAGAADDPPGAGGGGPPVRAPGPARRQAARARSGVREIEAVKGAWALDRPGRDRLSRGRRRAVLRARARRARRRDREPQPRPGRDRTGAQAGARRDCGRGGGSPAARQPGAVRGGLRRRSHARPVLGTAASVAALAPAALAARFAETHGAAAMTVVSSATSTQTRSPR